MSRLILIFLISTAISSSTLAQTAKKAKVSALPDNISKMDGKDSSDLLNNPIIKTRLQKLLGKNGYADFTESFETINPIIRKGNFLFSRGCLIHACGHVESAIAVDLVNKSIHVGIFREEEKNRFFNERKQKTPKVLVDWGNRLSKR